VAGDLSANHLAQIAPKPPACAKDGAGPCGDSVTVPGGDNPSSGGSSGSSDDTGTGTGDGNGGGDGTTGVPGSDGDVSGDSCVDPATGQDVCGGDNTAGGGTTAVANPVELSASRQGDSRLFGTLAVVELLALVLVPGLYVAWLRRRRAGGAK
jgi:hypothetical protein